MVSTLAGWVYLLGNLGSLATCGLLGTLSAVAYRRQPDQRSYLLATLGFGCIALGGVAELAFTLWFHPDFVLTRTEFLHLQAGEDVLIAAGLGLLFYAVTQHDANASASTGAAPSNDEEIDWLHRSPSEIE